MNVTGKLGKVGTTWSVRELATGKDFELSGVNFPERVEGLTIRVVGNVEDSFGGGILDVRVSLRVQRWDVV